MIRETLGRIFYAETVTVDNLAITPLLSSGNEAPDYLTLDEALARSEVRVTETSEAGVVSELRLENRAEQPVLLIDGEELVGAKQNRVLNLTILAPPRTTIQIPVSCVEAGRWSRSTPEFGTRGRTFYAAGRARKARHVTESLRSHGTRRSRQGEVWDDIREKSGRMGSRSATQAMASIYEDYDAQVERYLRAFQTVETQVGAVFAINGQVRGIELFDFNATLRRLYPKLLRSYALDAIDEQSRTSSNTAPDPRAFVAAVAAADESTHTAVGEGIDIRVQSDTLSGGGLQARGRLVHLCAFAPAEATTRTRNRHRGNSNTTSAGTASRAGTMATNPQVLDRLFREGAIDLERSSLFEQSAVPKTAGFDFDRVAGMLLGIAIGDALGVTTESQLPQTRRRRYGELRDYIPTRYSAQPRGFPSDDTQLSFWTLEQMIADNGFIPDHVARRFCSGRIYGIGQTLRRFLRHYKAGRPWYRCGPASAGNGALMRIAPVLIPHLRHGGTDLWADVALAAMLTHNDRASSSASIAFVAMLWELLDMEQAPAPSWWLDRYVALAHDLEGASEYSPRGGAFTGYRGPLWRFAQEQVSAAYRQRLSVVDACHGWHSGAYVLETVPSVLYILMRYGDDPEEAIVRAINDTKDNDSIAAIVGAAVGALHGRQALPARWIENLSGRTTDRDDGRVFELITSARRAFWA